MLFQMQKQLNGGDQITLNREFRELHFRVENVYLT